jgi:membrane protease YdiL (CAAX protease family)
VDWRTPAAFGAYGLVVGMGAGELAARVAGPLPPAASWIGLYLPILLYPSFSVGAFWGGLRTGWLAKDGACLAFLAAVACWAFLFGLSGPEALGLAACLCAAFFLVRRGARHPGSIAWPLGALAVLWLPFEFGWLGRMAVPGPGGLDLLPVLLLDAGLFLFLVYGRLDGVGFDFALTREDARAALRESAALALPLLLLGLATGFLAWAPRSASLLAEVLRPPAIYFLNALPEEFLFRGVLHNLLARRLPPAAALAVSSAVFGLSHVENAVGGYGFPNWRYVLMATVAGWFYGRAYARTGKVTASALVHTLVNWVWSLLLKIGTVPDHQ